MQESVEDIQKKIEARIDELPEPVRNAILSPEFMQHIQGVAQNFGLHIDQTQELADNTMMLMLSFFSEQEYRTELLDIMGRDEAKAQKIAEEINIKVILPVRGLLKDSSNPGSQSVEPAPATQVSKTLPPEGGNSVAPKIDLHPADVLLTQKTIAAANTSVAPAPQAAAAAKPQATTPEPPKPQDYTADPYREPVK